LNYPLTIKTVATFILYLIPPTHLIEQVRGNPDF
jgi:hypothetical protein